MAAPALTAVIPAMVPFAPGTTKPNAGGGVSPPPTANAGPNATGTTGYTSTLDGTGSTAAPGHTLTGYLWTQTAGPTVTITNATSATASYTPSTANNYTFQLKVTQDDSQTATSNVTDTISDPRQITWAGDTWSVKPVLASAGPGPNAWSDSTSNVYLDGNGKLHLAVVQDVNNIWRCSEIFGPHLGYGTYEWVVDTDLSAISQYFVIGMFVYDKTAPSPYREIDIEFSQFGNTANDRLWFTVQPGGTGQQAHLPIAGFTAPYTVQFDWTASTITWTATDSLGATIGTYTATPVQPTGAELVQMNVWLNAGHAPPGPLDVQFSSFTFTPAGAATAMGSITLAGSASAQAQAAATGSLSLGGTATGSFTATGSLTLSGSATAGSNATAAGSLSLAGSATAGTQGTATGSLALSGTVSNTTTATGAVSLTGTGTAASTGTVSGSLNLSGSGNTTFAAAGVLSLAGIAQAQATLTALGVLTLSGSASAHGPGNYATGSITLTGTATATVDTSTYRIKIGPPRMTWRIGPPEQRWRIGPPRTVWRIGG